MFAPVLSYVSSAIKLTDSRKYELIFFFKWWKQASIGNCWITLARLNYELKVINYLWLADKLLANSLLTLNHYVAFEASS